MPTYSQIQAMRARAQAKAYKPPKKTGSRDPYNALGGFTDLQGAYLDAVGRGPDYSGIEPIDFAALQRLADESATKRIQPFINQVQDERGYQNARRDVSNQAATNFTQAISGLFTGGRGIDDPEGQKHSLENFGGSYLGGMAAMLGTQLMAQIGHSFNDQDHELSNKISLLMDKHPEEADRIYGDLLASEQERVKQGRSIVDADYKSQIAALGVAIKFERDNMKGGAAGKPYVSYFTDPASGARIGVRPDGSVVPISGAASAEPMSASQVSMLLENADQIVSESVNNGATFKNALLQARMYLRDNGVKNYGQWAPYTTPAGPKAKTGKTPKGKGKGAASGLTPNQQAANLQDAEEIARRAFYGTKPNASGKLVPADTVEGFDPQDSSTWGGEPTGNRNYQATLRKLQRTYKLSLEDAQAILNQYWQPGDFGRPAFSYQERRALAKAGVRAAQIKRVQTLYNTGRYDEADALRAQILAAIGR